MADLILHQYDTSPFSEKIRKIFAHKHLAWRAVEQPTIMPKPQLIPLTGGYRKIPVLQIGADVYCDTQLIARIIEGLHPEPTLYPDNSEGACHAIGMWADRLFFFSTIPVLFALLGDNLPQAFIDDRTKMMPGRNFADIPKLAPYAKEQCRGFAAWLNAQLSDGRAFLLGQRFSLADAACYHPVWFLRNVPPAATVFDEFPKLIAWSERIKAMGHGQRSDMDPADALRIARESNSATKEVIDPNDPSGLKPGDKVAVTPDDYGFDPVAGTVVMSSVHEVAIRRQAAEVGEVVVHFPRVGFRVDRA
ncbi:MAG: glutathione S-transferase family protein [Deltaproteobacteria bacterium]|nr:glutathione S-transferase family protein [Deltaproteobacteria bacterium]MBI3388679.1 glutathione S-transferase family protein [Deltaproteobacteria bacterium]